MRWQVRWGASAGWLRDIAVSTGRVPPSLAEMPELEEDLDTYVSAFNWLTADRRTGFSIGPIPLSEIAHYYDRFGVEDEFEVFAHLVREMDNEYLKALKEKPSGDGT